MKIENDVPESKRKVYQAWTKNSGQTNTIYTAMDQRIHLT